MSSKMNKYHGSGRSYDAIEVLARQMHPYFRKVKPTTGLSAFSMPEFFKQKRFR